MHRMTVKDVRRALSELPDDWPVVISIHDNAPGEFQGFVSDVAPLPDVEDAVDFAERTFRKGIHCAQAAEIKV